MLKIWILTIALANADGLGDRLQRLVKSSALPASSLGLVVYDLHGPSGPGAIQIFGHNEKQEFIPASVTKLATAAAVLHRLGPSFKFQTTLWSVAEVNGSVLKGDLVLKGGGDSGFVSETMWFLVNELTRTGITQIDGHIVVDDTDFDSVRADTSRDPDRVDRAYDAPIGAMSFNWNTINIYVRPTRVGSPPTVHLDPIDNGYIVENRAKTVAKDGVALEVVRSGERIRVTGTIGVAHAEHPVYKNVDDPIEWSGRALQAFLAQRGIRVSGKIRAGKKPEKARLLAKVDSKPVAQHVADMMKFSNNYVAEMLTKNLAAQDGVVPASLEEGMKRIRSSMEQLEVSAEGMTLVNPSGLSRRNRVRPTDLALILVQAHKQFPWFGEFLTALPLAGQDGTMKRRLKDSPAAGWVRAKTGMLNGVAALAGYAGRKDGSLRAFAFVYNGKNDLGESARHLFDALAEQLVQ